jgi:hypothetical protein
MGLFKNGALENKANRSFVVSLPPLAGLAGLAGPEKKAHKFTTSHQGVNDQTLSIVDCSGGRVRFCDNFFSSDVAIGCGAPGMKARSLQ